MASPGANDNFLENDALNAKRRFAAARFLRRILHRLDAADLRILKLLPIPLKRKLYRGLFRRLASIGRGDVVTVDGFLLHLPPNAWQVFSNDGLELEVRSLIRKTLQPGDVAIDVGAYIGFHTLLMAKLVGEEGAVHSFEPAPDNLLYLRKNVDKNGFGNVKIHPCAAGTTNSEVEFYVGETSTLNSRSSQYKWSKKIRISEKKIDNLAIDRVKLVKIDVEGYELQVLEGMSHTLAKSHDICLIIEWNPDALVSSGHHPDDLPKLLLAEGFLLAPASKPNHLFHSLKELHVECGMDQRNYTNLFAVRDPAFVC